MKFLCPQCKAKYQIPDEKIAGRTLRMKCRRCEHDIVVKGDTDALAVAHDEAARPAPAAARPTPGVAGRKAAEPARSAPKSRGSGSGAGPLPKGSALGADFRKNVGQTEPPRASIPSPLDAWHVSINDVPVGPMRREELARKISTGAVTGDSLCWREGYDDWRPVRDTELNVLLARRSAAPPAPPAAGARPVPGAPPARGAAPVGRPAAAARPAPGVAGRPVPGARPAPAPAVRPAAAARSNVVPIGGRHGAAAAPALDDAPDSFDENEATTIAQSPFEDQLARPSTPDAAALGALAATSAPAHKSQSVPPPAGPISFSTPDPSGFPQAPPSMLSEPPAVKRSKGLPIGAWMGIVFAGAAGAAIAVILGLKFILPAQQQAVAENDTHVVAPPPVAPTVPDHVEATPTPPTAVGNDTTPTPPTNDTNDTPGNHHAPVKHGTGAAGTGTGTTPPTPPSHANISAADRAALAALAADGTGTTPTNVAAHTTHVVEETDTQGPEMSADQLRTVVTRGRPALQHCYELVARQSGSSETMRVDVHIVVGGSGVITRADATGTTEALNSCIEREVRRWHFPGGGEAGFPLVFQPQGG